MDLWRLKVFCSVIDAGGFSRAAKDLGLTQPSVSSHIKELESQFDCRLVDRVSRQAQPTKAGEILYRSARKLLKDYEKLKTALAEYHGHYSGPLSIGASNIPGEYILPSKLSPFQERYPDIVISLLIRNSENIIEQILDGGIELGFVGTTVREPRICQEPFFEDDMCLILPVDNPWCDCGEIDPDDLRNIPFISRMPGSGTLKTFQERIRQQGFDIQQLKTVAELGSTTAVIQGIKNGLGGSVLSTIAVRDELAAGLLKAVRIRGVDLQRHFYLTYQKNRSLTPLARLFIDYIREND